MEDFKTTITTDYIMKNLRCNWNVYDPKDECNTIEGLLQTILDAKFQKFKLKTKGCAFWKSFVPPEITKGDNIEDHIKALFQQWNIVLDMAVSEVNVKSKNVTSKNKKGGLEKIQQKNNQPQAVEKMSVIDITLNPQQGATDTTLNQIDLGMIATMLTNYQTEMMNKLSEQSIQITQVQKQLSEQNDKIGKIEEEVASLIGSIQVTDSTLVQLEDRMVKGFKDMDLRLEQTDKKMHTISKNIGCLYELAVEGFLSKRNEWTEITNGLFLKQDNNNRLMFEEVKNQMENDGWVDYLNTTTMSQNNKNCLTSRTRSVEINFCCKEGADVDIMEATISNLGDKEKLFAKLIQLERQVRFYEALNGKVRTIGLISPHSVELSNIAQIVNLNTMVFKNVKSKIETKCFLCHKLGFKSEVDI